MPDKDQNFGGSLVLDFKKWWRHVKTIYYWEYKFKYYRTLYKVKVSKFTEQTTRYKLFSN